MRVLITGACGFVGRHLARELLQHGHEPVLASHEKKSLNIFGKTFEALTCDVRDLGSVASAVADARPDAVAHLAGLAHVLAAAKDRELLSATNILGMHNICTALDRYASDAKPIPLLFTSTSFIYGNEFVGRASISEATMPAPNSPYGASKLAAEYVGRSFDSAHLKVYVARPFNHIGPGQSTMFACPGFASRILAAPDGGVIDVGNLSSLRDFCDVRDIVRAYRLILEQQPKSRLFVLGSGKSVSMRSVLDRLIHMSGKRIETRIDPQLYRPDDLSDMVADSSKALEELGWRAEIDIDTSLRDVYAALRDGAH